MSGINISEALAEELAEFRKGQDRALVLKISKEQCELAERVSGSGDLKADVKAIAELLGNDVRYILIKTSEKDYIFGTFNPDDGSVREKMIYASSMPLIGKQLPNHTTQMWTDADEFAEQVVANEIASDREAKTNRGDGVSHDAYATGVSEAALTPAELSQRKQATAEKTERATRQSGAAVSLELPSEATEALNSIKRGDFIALVVRGEDLHMHDHARDLGFNDVPDRFGPEPTYGVYHDHESITWFIYRCPDEVTTKQRMIAASCRNGVVQRVESILSIHKTIETSDNVQFETVQKEPEQAPSEFLGGEMRKIRRPAKPGRVPRR